MRSRLIRTLLCASTIALCAALLLSVHAQAKQGMKYALLIGVKDYEHPKLAKLRFTENDVEALAERLQSNNMNFTAVRILTSSRGEKNADDMPTAENIRKEIDAILEKAGGNDTVLLAFSGHGVQLSVPDPNEDEQKKGKDKLYPYFCPSDSDFRNISYSTGKAKRLIQLEALFADLGASRAREKLVLIDACRNELKADSATRGVGNKSVSVPRGVAVLFSCDEDEVSWENPKLGKNGHGVFFHFVLEGLSGKLKNEDNDVTWDELSAYVKRQVSKKTPTLIGDGAKQTPYGLNNAGETILARFDAGNNKPDTEVVKGKPRKGDVVTNSIGMKLVYIPKG